MRRRGARLLAIAAIGAAGLWLAILAWPSPPLPEGVRADLVRLDKSERRLTIFRDGEPLKTYRVSLGGGEPGAKTRQGDRRTPEGDYRISGRNPGSDYNLALRVSYPSPADIAAAAARGENPGGDIMIHGLPNGYGFVGGLHRLVDWTAGCIAVTDSEIEELWRAVPDGTPIEIRP